MTKGYTLGLALAKTLTVLGIVLTSATSMAQKVIFYSEESASDYRSVVMERQSDDQIAITVADSASRGGYIQPNGMFVYNKPSQSVDKLILTREQLRRNLALHTPGLAPLKGAIADSLPETKTGGLFQGVFVYFLSALIESSTHSSPSDARVAGMVAGAAALRICYQVYNNMTCLRDTKEAVQILTAEETQAENITIRVSREQLQNFIMPLLTGGERQ